MKKQAKGLENDKEIMDELVVPERRGVLQSTRYKSVGEKIVQENGVGFCDNCGYRLDPKLPLVICNHDGCGKKLCTGHSCFFEYRRNYYCGEHIRDLLPVSIHGFEIIHSINSGLAVDKVKELAGISHDEYQEALREVLDAGYLVRKGLSVFSSFQLTGKGALCWKTYFEAFKQDGDVAQFIEKVAMEPKKVR